MNIQLQTPDLINIVETDDGTLYLYQSGSKAFQTKMGGLMVLYTTGDHIMFRQDHDDEYHVETIYTHDGKTIRVVSD